MRYNRINEFKEHPLKEQVKRANVRAYDLAEAIGISQGYLSMLLNGVKPMPKHLEKDLRRALKPFNPQPIRKKIHKKKKGKKNGAN